MSWPIIWPTGQPAEGVDPKLVEYAGGLARQALSVLTAGRMGGETVTVAPNHDTRCRWAAGYFWQDRWYFGVTPAAAHLKWGGVHHHNGIYLGDKVASIIEVTHGAEVIPPTAYGVVDGRYLVRRDGQEWPAWEHDDFLVTFFEGHTVDVTGQVITGILANEFLKAVTSAKNCKLPSNLTTVTRSGMSFTMSTELFPNNATGLTEVDTYVFALNPNSFTVAPAVYTPDIRKPRRVNWR